MLNRLEVLDELEELDHYSEHHFHLRHSETEVASASWKKHFQILASLQVCSK